jgi:hypothetical protein
MCAQMFCAQNFPRLACLPYRSGEPPKTARHSADCLTGLVKAFEIIYLASGGRPIKVTRLFSQAGAHWLGATRETDWKLPEAMATHSRGRGPRLSITLLFPVDFRGALPPFTGIPSASSMVVMILTPTQCYSGPRDGSGKSGGHPVPPAAAAVSQDLLFPDLWGVVNTYEPRTTGSFVRCRGPGAYDELHWPWKYGAANQKPSDTSKGRCLILRVLHTYRERCFVTSALQARADLSRREYPLWRNHPH